MADGSKIDLCFLSWLGLQRNGDLMSLHTALTLEREQMRLTAEMLPLNSACSWRSRSWIARGPTPLSASGSINAR